MIITQANILPKSLRDKEAIVDGTETKCNHQTKTFIIFSVIFEPEKLNKYHFAVPQTQENFKDIPKNVKTVINHKTSVVFKSLFIGLKYFKKVGEIEPHTQSITSQNKFQNKITIKNQAINGKNALENFLSWWNESIIFLSKIEIKFKIATLSLEFSFFNAIFANIEKTKTIKKNAKVATFVLLIGP